METLLDLDTRFLVNSAEAVYPRVPVLAAMSTATAGKHKWIVRIALGIKLFQDLDGSRTQHGTVSAMPGGSTMPIQVELYQNYPNPFNPVTEIQFALPEGAATQLSVFSVNGQLIGQLVNQYLTPGMHAVAFDASYLPSGVYLYRLTTGTYSIQRKMLLLK